MKKFLLLVAIFTLLLSPTIIHAQSPIIYGITSNGIRYEAASKIIALSEDQITIEKTYMFEGNVTVEFSIAERLETNGDVYEGTLYLVSRSYNAISDKTTATYRGTLYKSSSN